MQSSPSSPPWWYPALLPEEMLAAAPGSGDPDASDMMLEAWESRLGGPEPWRTRLAFDGIEVHALRSVYSAAANIPEPAWVDFCHATLQGFESGWPEDHQDIPMGQILLAFARRGLENLKTAAGDAWERRSPGDGEAVVLDFLARRLTTIASTVLCPAFDAFRNQGHHVSGDAPDALYQAWIARLRNRGLRDLLARYPVWARILSVLTMDAADGLAEMFLRLDADAGPLGPALFEGKVPGRLSGLHPGLSDRHNHGRQVCALDWPDGRRVYYKPKSGDVDAAWHAWVRDLRDHEGLQAELAPPLPVLAREGYCWVAAAIPGTSAKPDDYARKAGGLAALAYALEARDLIMDNLVATADGPVVIDAEAMLQPLCAPATFAPGDISPALIEKLRDYHRFELPHTGLLGIWQDAASGPVDIGGLTGGGDYRSRLPQFQVVDANLDTMRLAKMPAVVGKEANLPPGASGVAASWLPPAAMREGFRRVAEVLVARADDLAGDGPGSLRDRFGRCTGRFLLRPTGSYARVLLSMTDGMAMRHAILHRLGAEVLLKPFLSVPNRPPASWPLLSSEVQSLVRRDIPFFPFVVGDDQKWHIAGSALDMARARVRSLDAASLHRQERLLRCALVLRPVKIAEPDPRILAARVAGEFLLQSPDDEETDWLPSSGSPGASPFPAIAVYHGRSGAAFFLAALSHATGDERYARRARQELLRIAKALPDAMDSAPPGASDGLGGVLHASLRASRWLGDLALEKDFTDLARRFARRLMETPEAGDLAGGMAGGVFALLGLAGDFPGLAQTCDELAIAAVPILRATAADIDGSRGEIGFAHGWSGLAAVLIRAGRRAGDARACDEALRLLSLAAKHAEGRGWEQLPVHPASPPDARPMHAWCHGFPGFICALAEWQEGNTRDPRTIDWLERAASGLAKVPAHSSEDSCCGNAGRLESLREAAALGVAAASTGLAQAASDLLARRLSPGLFRVANVPEDAFLLSPGFFKGQAGPAYLFLRLARPKDFPSLLRWR